MPAMQELIVIFIVGVCGAYVCLTLMPQAWRLALLRRLPLRQSPPDSACGACGGCGSPPAASPAAQVPKTIIWHRRPPAA